MLATGQRKPLSRWAQKRACLLGGFASASAVTREKLQPSPPVNTPTRDERSAEQSEETDPKQRRRTGDTHLAEDGNTNIGMINNCWENSAVYA